MIRPMLIGWKYGFPAIGGSAGGQYVSVAGEHGVKDLGVKDLGVWFVSAGPGIHSVLHRVEGVLDGIIQASDFRAIVVLCDIPVDPRRGSLSKGRKHIVVAQVRERDIDAQLSAPSRQLGKPADELSTIGNTTTTLQSDIFHILNTKADITRTRFSGSRPPPALGSSPPTLQYEGPSGCKNVLQRLCWSETI